MKAMWIAHYSGLPPPRCKDPPTGTLIVKRQLEFGDVVTTNGKITTTLLSGYVRILTQRGDCLMQMTNDDL